MLQLLSYEVLLGRVWSHKAHKAWQCRQPSAFSGQNLTFSMNFFTSSGMSSRGSVILTVINVILFCYYN